MEIILGLGVLILGGILVKIEKRLDKINDRIDEVETGLTEEIRDCTTSKSPEHDPSYGATDFE